MKGYKVFNPDWTCRGFKFEVGKTFEENIEPLCCRQGFHFCTKASDCFKYYSFNPNNKVAEVEALGTVDTKKDDSKCSTNKIHIVRELSWHEVLDLVNLGKDCTGYCNSGYCNSGDYNSGSYSNGCFNTKESKINLFNQPSEWTRYDWLHSKARYIMNKMPINHLQWVDGKDMTDEEKERHPKYEIAGGFLKYIKEETTRQAWWDELPDNDKKEIENLPNFDKDIFKEITGINVGEE